MTDKPTLKMARHLFVAANGKTKAAGGNVVLNFMGSPRRELALIGDEFFEAVKVLIDGLAQKGSYSDLKAYPTVFLYRHALELYLKALLDIGNNLAGLLRDERLEIDVLKELHPLTPLLDKTEHLFSALGWSWEDYGISGLTAEGFRSIVSEFDAVDRNSYAFRYPLKKNGTASVEEHFAFSLLEMSRVLDPVLTMLSNAWMTLEEYHSQLSEAAYLTRQAAYDNCSNDYYDAEP